VSTGHGFIVSTPERRPGRRRGVSRWAKASGLLAAALLAACATQQPVTVYKPSANAPQARLLMRGSIGAGEFYGVYLMSDPYACKGLQRVGAGSAKTDPPAVSIDATGLATVEVFFTKPDNRSYCRIRWSFYPKEKRSYLVAAQQSATECRARVMDATDPDAIKVESTAVRRNVGANPCVPMSQIQASTIKQIQADTSAAQPQARTADDGKGKDVTLQPSNDDALKGLIGSGS